jgi:hypothetical protein
VELLLLFEVGVELGDTLECQFLGQADVVRLFHVLVSELLDLGWVGSTEELNLLLPWHNFNDLLHDRLEVSRQHLVDFINHEHFAVV